MADWSSLPCDILGAIVLKFDDIEDCVRFRAVCHSFNHAYTTIKEMINYSGFIPWLILAENTEENPECYRRLFNLNTNKCYQLRLPETFGRRCWGSSYGWLVTVGLDLEMHLFNPLTKAQIRLPHLSTLPTFIELKGVANSEWFRVNFVSKAIVLRIPDEFIVMLVYGERCEVAFSRLGDQAWTPIEGPRFDRIVYAEDFCYWDDKILVIYDNGRLGYCDITSSSPHVQDLLPAPPKIRDNKYGVLTQNTLYLVNSNNELLIVMRYTQEVSGNDDSDDEEGNNSYKTIEFALFRPNFHTKEWTKIDDLEDLALFLGDSHSMSRNNLNSRNCLRNRIYFTDDEMIFWEVPKNFGGHDMGAFDIGDKDGDIIPFYEGGDIHSAFCTPLWFTPMI